MRRFLVMTVTMVLGSGVAMAQAPQPQPAAQPQQPMEPPPQQPVPPQQYQPPPPPGYVYGPPVALSPEEQQLLAEGEMPLLNHAGGGALAFVLGFGTGHILQGRWIEQGWVFTVGESASMAALIIGVRDFCIDCNNTRAGLLITGGILGMLGFHVWEVLDAFIVPGNRNKRVRALRQRLGYPQVPQNFSLYLSPPKDGSGAIGGLTLRF